MDDIALGDDTFRQEFQPGRGLQELTSHTHIHKTIWLNKFALLMLLGPYIDR